MRSRATLRKGILSNGMSTVASAPSGRGSPGSFGSGIGTRVMKEEREGGIGGSLCKFLGVEMKETWTPALAKAMES